MTTTYLKPADRSAQLLAAAVELSVKHGYMSITRDQVGAAAGVAPSLINRYFNNMDGLRNAVVREAVRARVLPIIAQGVAINCRRLRGVSHELRNEATASLRK